LSTSPPGFPGFQDGKQALIPIPAEFFSDLLPQIDHLGELQVTLYAFWVLARREGTFRYLSKREMAKDERLMTALTSPGLTPEAALAEALERAVTRGTLLHVGLEFDQGVEDFYFVNSAKGRAAVSAAVNGEWSPSGDPLIPLSLVVERPNVYTLYEQNIGPLTPMLAERLRDAERQYPAGWIEEAIGIAVENNVRKWRYIEAILEAWEQRGKDEREDRGDSEKARRRYIQGKLADYWDS
jgi:DnaD/phage-associated family protein